MGILGAEILPGLDGDLGLGDSSKRQLSTELKTLFNDLPTMGLPTDLARSLTEELVGLLQPGGAGGSSRGMSALPPLGGAPPNAPREPSGLAVAPGLPVAPQVQEAAAELQETLNRLNNHKGAGGSAEGENVNAINEANRVLERLNSLKNMGRAGAQGTGTSGEDLGNMLTRLRKQGSGGSQGGPPGLPMDSPPGGAGATGSPRNPVLVTDVAACSGLRGVFGKQAAQRAEEDMRTAGGRMERQTTIGLEVLAALKRSREVARDTGGTAGLQERQRQRMDCARAVQQRLGSARAGPAGRQKGVDLSTSQQEIEELLRRTSSLEKNNRSLNMRLAFMNRLNSEQTIRIEQLEREKKELEMAAENLQQ